jgi:cyanuric acid amidohydrolase
MKVEVFRCPVAAPEDVTGLEKLLDDGVVKPGEVVAIIGKSEGNGSVNDFTRGYTNFVLRTRLAERMGMTREEVERRVPMIQSGGCEGVMTPHFNVFVRREDGARPSGEKRFSIGIGFTRDLLPEEVGTMAQVREVARAIEVTMADARITDPADVHFVQMKTPLLTPEDVDDAARRGHVIPRHISSESMAFANAAAALGVALALGEIPESELSDEMILQQLDLYSSVACPSSGIELKNCHIVLLGNSTESTSDGVIGHAVMQDALDAEAVRQAMRNAGLKFDQLPRDEDLKRIQLVIAKAGIHPRGWVRGRRTTLVTDSDLHGRQIRAVFSAVIGSVLGDPLVCLSGAPTVGTHSGPPGGGIVAVVAQALA